MKRYAIERFSEREVWCQIQLYTYLQRAKDDLKAWRLAYRTAKYRLVEIIETRTVLEETK